MYIPAEFEAIGVGIHPVKASRFDGGGQHVDSYSVPDDMVFSFDIEGIAHERMELCDVMVNPGEILFLWPRMWHRLTETEGVPVRSIWFEVDGAAVPRITTAFGVTRRRPVCKPTDYQQAYTAFREIVDAFTSNRVFAPAHFLRRFFRLAEMCSPAIKAPGLRPRGPKALVDRAIHVCKTESQKFPTVPQLCTRLGVAQNTLLTACRRELGISTVQLLIRLKIERAKELLKETDHKVVVIAGACGFDSFSHFVSCFRQAEGTTPTAWRRK